LEGQFHLLFNTCQVDPRKSFNEASLTNAVFFVSLKGRIKPIIDDSRQVCVLEKCDVINVILLIVGLFGRHPPLCNVHKNVGEVRLDNFIKESTILFFVKLFNQQEVVCASLCPW
jgi:hypothetical protein